jgi:hypothetical protein
MDSAPRAPIESAARHHLPPCLLPSLGVRGRCHAPPRAQPRGGASSQNRRNQGEPQSVLLAAAPVPVHRSTPASKWQTALALNAVGFSANSDLQDQTREAGSESMRQRAIKGPQRATFAERTTRAQRRFDRFSVSIARGHPDRFRVQGMPPLSGVSGLRKVGRSAHLPRERRLLLLCLLRVVSAEPQICVADASV